ncbi:MAG: hypothetical protein HY307_00540 [Arcobacter sp.]|nr:hypothetical protein [Arcobacter sp.]
MTKSTPPSDWIAYAVVGAVSLSMLLGKYLIARGDTPIGQVIDEEIVEIKHIAEDFEHKIEEKFEEITK